MSVMKTKEQNLVRELQKWISWLLHIQVELIALTC